MKMIDLYIQKMVLEICAGRSCRICPLYRHCQRPWTEEDGNAIVDAYNKMFGPDIIIDSDELVKVLEDG